MNIHCFTLVILFSGIIFICSADAVVFETDFLELPNNWWATTFEFGPTGAVIDYFGSSSFDANLLSGQDYPNCYSIFIPDGTDSVHVEIAHTLNVSGGEHPNMEFRIWLGSESHGSDVVWSVDVNYQNPQCNHSGSTLISPDWLLPGEFLSIYFRADVIPDEWGSSVYWRIFNLEVTAFGDDLSLHSTTWGGIKSTLGYR